LIDKYGTKIGYSISIAAWSLAAMGHALVGSVGGFLWARVALGLGEGGNFPAAIKATAIWFPKKERARRAWIKERTARRINLRERKALTA